MFSHLPARYKLGFLLGGLSLVLVIGLWISSRPSARPDMAREEPPVVTTTGTFVRGTLLYDALKNRGLTPKQSFDIGASLKKVLDPRNLKSGDRYAIVQSTAGAFQRLVIARGLKEYVVEASTGTPPLDASVRNIPLTSTRRSARGRIGVSLWESMVGQGIDPNLIATLANDIFAWTIDFNLEPRQGDAFSLIWDEQATPTGEVADRRVLAAVYDGERTGQQTAILFRDEYYDADGRSLRKAFLHAPLRFTRISSGFGRRFHPILRTWRKHPGTDYTAPRGTPVHSVGSGVVTFKGWKTVYGNNVEVRHNATYTSGYGHFSRFAKGIRAGTRVAQGQVIGYVGSTGWATGPHVCFRMLANGKFVNFRKLKFPPDKNVPADLMAEFNALKKQRLEELEGIPDKSPAN